VEPVWYREARVISRPDTVDQMIIIQWPGIQRPGFPLEYSHWKQRYPMDARSEMQEYPLVSNPKDLRGSFGEWPEHGSF